jgi:hypothetical protein
VPESARFSVFQQIFNKFTKKPVNLILNAQFSRLFQQSNSQFPAA